jgi:hypothetical protein
LLGFENDLLFCHLKHVLELLYRELFVDLRFILNLFGS